MRRLPTPPTVHPPLLLTPPNFPRSSPIFCPLLTPSSGHLSPEVHDLLFSLSPASYEGPPRARQAIINLYWPGEGIMPHVDLLDRYRDSIMGVSLGSGYPMQFARVVSDQPQTDAPSPSPSTPQAFLSDQCVLYLPKGSMVIMTGEAQYG